MVSPSRRPGRTAVRPRPDGTVRHLDDAPQRPPSVPMRSPATAAATAAAPGFTRGSFPGAAGAGSEHGELLGEFCRAAMRTPGSRPIGGANKDFAVPLALAAMKFVNWHGLSISIPHENSSPSRCALLDYGGSSFLLVFLRGGCVCWPRLECRTRPQRLEIE
jgi:hypothetical protein